MLVKRTSTLTGKTHQLDIPITHEHLEAFELNGVIFTLSSAHVRYLQYGITPEEWQQQLDELDKNDDTDPNSRYHS